MAEKRKETTTLYKPNAENATRESRTNKGVRDKLTSDIKTGKFEHIYMLCGDDGYLRKNFAEALIKAIAGDDEMNVTRFASGNVNGLDIVSICQTMPFLADRRVVYVENTGHFRLERNAQKPGTEELADFLPELPDTTILIFNDENIDKRLKLWKSVKKCGAYVAELNHRSPAELVTWIGASLKKQGVQITREAAEALIERVGIDMNTLRNEMAKLVAYNGDKKGITLDDIRAISTNRIDDVFVELFEAAVIGDVAQTMQIYKSILAAKVEPISIIISLGKTAASTIGFFELIDKHLEEAEIARIMGCQTGAVYHKKKLIRYASVSKLEDIVKLSSTLNEEIVSGNMEADLACEVMISSLLA